MATSSIRIQQCALVELCPHPDGQHCDSESTDAEHSRLADWAHLNRKRCRTAERVVSDHSPCQPSDGRQNSTSLLHHHGRMRFTAIHPEYISTGRMHGDHESHRSFPPISVLGAYASLIIPNDLRGRVFSVFSLFNITLASLASGIAGIMLSSLGYMIARRPPPQS